LQSVPPAKLNAPADVKQLRSKRVDAIHAPRIVMEQRGLLGVREGADACFEAPDHDCFGMIAGAVLLVKMTVLITGVNASEGWRSVILGCLILAMLLLSGPDQSR